MVVIIIRVFNILILFIAYILSLYYLINGKKYPLAILLDIIADNELKELLSKQI